MSAGDLLKKVREGEVTPQTHVRKEDSAWFPADEVGGLFEAAFQDQPEKIRKSLETEHHGD
jgi:hypothetical protein